jgi:hypothetical protein
LLQHVSRPIVTRANGTASRLRAFFYEAHPLTAQIQPPILEQRALELLGRGSNVPALDGLAHQPRRLLPRRALLMGEGEHAHIGPRVGQRDQRPAFFVRSGLVRLRFQPVSAMAAVYNGRAPLYLAK